MKEAFRKINFLLNSSQKKKIIFLLFLLLFGMILEIFSLGVIVPILTILLNPESIAEKPWLSFLFDSYPIFFENNSLYFFLGFLIFIYLLKTCFMILLSYKQNKFLSNLSGGISNNLFSNYLSQPYSFHLNRNTSELIKNIHGEVNYFHQYLIALISFITELLLVISLLSTLIYIEPFGAISVFLFLGALSIIFLYFSNKKLKKWGSLRQELDSQISKITLEGLGSIKDLIINGNGNFFKDKFEDKVFYKAKLNAYQLTISQVPRFYLELISIIGLVFFIVLMIIQGKDVATLITVIGLFVAATFRILPSINKIIASIQNMKFFKPGLDIIHNEIKTCNKIDTSLVKKDRYNLESYIEFTNVDFNFNKHIQVLNGVNLKINRGQTIGIMGESGSGKSTLVDLLVGLHRPQKGAIYIDGTQNLQLDQSWRNSIGYVSQTIYLTDDTIKNNIAFGVPENMIDLSRINKLIEQTQLVKFINEQEFGINTMVGERGVQISGGQRQRIGIARALYHNPSILILDEATSALDSDTENEIMKSITNLKEDKTIIIIAHRLNTLTIADSVYSIMEKKIKKIDKANLFKTLN